MFCLAKCEKNIWLEITGLNKKCLKRSERLIYAKTERRIPIFPPKEFLIEKSPIK